LQPNYNLLDRLKNLNAGETLRLERKL
jgi:hypothetical protein